MVETVPADAYRIYDINLRQHFYSKELIDRSLRIANVLKINDDELVRLQEMFALPEDTGCCVPPIGGTICTSHGRTYRRGSFQLHLYPRVYIYAADTPGGSRRYRRALAMPSPEP